MVKCEERTIKTYSCSICNNTFSNETEAIRCENRKISKCYMCSTRYRSMPREWEVNDYIVIIEDGVSKLAIISSTYNSCHSMYPIITSIRDNKIYDRYDSSRMFRLAIEDAKCMVKDLDILREYVVVKEL